MADIADKGDATLEDCFSNNDKKQKSDDPDKTPPGSTSIGALSQPEDVEMAAEPSKEPNKEPKREPKKV